LDDIGEIEREIGRCDARPHQTHVLPELTKSAAVPPGTPTGGPVVDVLTEFGDRFPVGRVWNVVWRIVTLQRVTKDADVAGSGSFVEIAFARDGSISYDTSNEIFLGASDG